MTQPKAWMTKDPGNGQYAMWGQKPTSDYYTEHPEKLIELYTAAQLREAQVAVLREAAEWFDPRRVYFAHDAANYLNRMADELEKQK